MLNQQTAEHRPSSGPWLTLHQPPYKPRRGIRDCFLGPAFHGNDFGRQLGCHNQAAWSVDMLSPPPDASESPSHRIIQRVPGIREVELNPRFHILRTKDPIENPPNTRMPRHHCAQKADLAGSPGTKARAGFGCHCRGEGTNNFHLLKAPGTDFSYSQDYHFQLQHIPHNSNKEKKHILKQMEHKLLLTADCNMHAEKP